MPGLPPNIGGTYEFPGLELFPGYNSAGLYHPFEPEYLVEEPGSPTAAAAAWLPPCPDREQAPSPEEAAPNIAAAGGAMLGPDEQ